MRGHDPRTLAFRSCPRILRPASAHLELRRLAVDGLGEVAVGFGEVFVFGAGEGDGDPGAGDEDLGVAVEGLGDLGDVGGEGAILCIFTRGTPWSAQIYWLE